MSTRKSLIPEFFTLEWVKEQENNGKTREDLYYELGVSSYLFYRWMKDLGWEPNKEVKNEGKELYKQAKRYRDQGYTVRQIASVLDVSKSTVDRVLKKFEGEL